MSEPRDPLPPPKPIDYRRPDAFEPSRTSIAPILQVLVGFLTTLFGTAIIAMSAERWGPVSIYFSMIFVFGALLALEMHVRNKFGWRKLYLGLLIGAVLNVLFFLPMIGLQTCCVGVHFK